ncbi:hypothetical protein GCM10011386_17610 [Parapedobacter defluvii]|uniref:Methane oxygenase PmoA n=1 Tax=Parapedobacter defluvii TaxID=2045106 RepID=A0ABQ1LPJ6_9SPHI|nr:DUF6807 family protein [Parapedobacter defluvii]GGC26068.1 hypothetical protein GCM10011386_17610 [Parapedobacter defluvii]
MLVAELGTVSVKKIRLIEVAEGKRVEKPFQLIDDTEPRIYWKLDGVTPAGSKRIFEFERGKPTEAPFVSADKQADDLVVKGQDKQPLLTYRYTVKAPPEGVDPLYGRAGYIHPLYTPSGKVLTRIQPPDHYHHYGIWNPWTKISYGGKEYDLWNLGGNKGTVRFVKFDRIEQGAENYNFPEPIRVWPFDGNGGRGDQFFNFSPTKNKDWVLMAGHTYTLTYRLVVFDGRLSASEAESMWQSFAHPPEVKVQKM